MGIEGVLASASSERGYTPAGVPLCFCDGPATDTCQCCHAPRCIDHLDVGLCDRCTKAVNRAYAARANLRWVSGTLTVVIAVVEGVLAGLKIYLLLAIPFGILAAWAVGRLQYAYLIDTLGPAPQDTGSRSAQSLAAFDDYGPDSPFDEAYDDPYGYDDGAGYHGSEHDAGGHDAGGHDH